MGRGAGCPQLSRPSVGGSGRALGPRQPGPSLPLAPLAGKSPWSGLRGALPLGAVRQAPAHSALTPRSPFVLLGSLPGLRAAGARQGDGWAGVTASSSCSF